MSDKIFKVRGHNIRYTDDEIVVMIKDGQLKGSDYLSTDELKTWIKVEDSIYGFYLEKEEENEDL